MNVRVFLLSFLIAASAFAGSGKTPNSFILGTDFGVKTGFTLNTIITSIGSSDVKVILDGGQWDVDVNVTIPANITLSLPPGSFIDLGIAKTVTFSGGSLEAPQTTIFVGGGSVVGTVKSLADWTGDWGSAVVLATYTLTHIQQLTGSSIVSNTITSLEILDRTIQDIDIAIGGVNSSNILDRTILPIDISTGGVTTVEILDGTINSNDVDAATLALFTNQTISGDNFFIAELSTTQGIASVTETLVLFTENIYSNGIGIAANSTFTPLTNGIYSISASVINTGYATDGAGGGDVASLWLYSGTDRLAHLSAIDTRLQQMTSAGTITTYLTTSDVLSVRYYTGLTHPDGPPDMYIYATAAEGTFFCVTLIKATTL